MCHNQTSATNNTNGLRFVLIIVWICVCVCEWCGHGKSINGEKNQTSDESEEKNIVHIRYVHHLNPINEIIRECNLIIQKPDNDKRRRRRDKSNPARTAAAAAHKMLFMLSLLKRWMKNKSRNWREEGYYQFETEHALKYWSQRSAMNRTRARHAPRNRWTNVMLCKSNFIFQMCNGSFSMMMEASL